MLAQAMLIESFCVNAENRIRLKHVTASLWGLEQMASSIPQSDSSVCPFLFERENTAL